tara:strand:+ start:173 stop:1165 length:993 start_codon:yes stop_codon:yes gene_type:complete
MKKIEIIRSYRDKYGMEMPSLKLARIIYKENNLLWNNVDSIRSLLRQIEGKSGDKLRNIKTNLNYRMQENRPLNPYGLPESEEVIYEPFIIKGIKRLGILSDIHLPYHNLEALTEALTCLKMENVDGVLLNGDTLDIHTLSRFVRDPKKKDFKFEIDTLRLFLDKLDEILKCKIFFKIGNHEARYQDFLFMKAHEISGIEDFEFSNIIRAKQRGIEMIDSNQYMKLNDLNGLHGHEYRGGAFAPVNIARGLYTRGKVSAFQGHNHQTSEHTESDMDGKIVTTWSIGCLSELHPAYMPLNKWNHGYAWVELDDNGKDYKFHNKRIYKGKTL